MSISNEEFVQIWTKATTKDEVREKTKMTEPAINGRVQFLKRIGVKLKSFPTKKKSVDVKRLNDLIAKAAAR